MTRNLALLAAVAAFLCMATPARAQTATSSVTLYGVVDAFVEYGHAGTINAPVSRTRLESGGLNGSRLGVRESEDLGGGLKANVVLEHGLLADSGQQATNAAFWNRQAWVGLSGGFGSVSAGRQYTPLLTHQDNFDTSLSTTGYGSPYNSGVMRTVSRVNNSVLYSLPAGLPVGGSLMVAAGEGGTGRGWSASLRRTDGPLSFGAGWLAQKGFGAASEDKVIWNLAASYRVGPALLAAAVQRTKNDRQMPGTEDDRRELFAGATYAIGEGELRAAYGQGSVCGLAASTARHGSLAYVHHLSKRTALYTAVQEVHNPDNLGYRGTDGFTFDAIATGLPAGAGVTARAYAVGVRHRF